MLFKLNVASIFYLIKKKKEMPNWHFWWLFELLDTCCLLDNNKWKLNGHKLMLIDKLQFVSLFSIRCAGNECEIVLNRNGHRRAVTTATKTTTLRQQQQYIPSIWQKFGYIFSFWCGYHTWCRPAFIYSHVVFFYRAVCKHNAALALDYSNAMNPIMMWVYEI